MYDKSVRMRIGSRRRLHSGNWPGFLSKFFTNVSCLMTCWAAVPLKLSISFFRSLASISILCEVEFWRSTCLPAEDGRCLPLLPRSLVMDKQQVETGDGSSSCILQGYDIAKLAPTFFTCTSGELLWGQVHTVIEGFTAGEVDTALGPQEVADPSGTVLACSFRFRALARKGSWKVEAAFLDSFDGQPWHIGFVCHHVDVEGLEILKRAAEAGIGSTGTFGALEVVFVDRYDWSGSYSPGCELIVETVEGKAVDPEEDFDDETYYRSLVGGRFMLVDTQGFTNLIQALKDGEKLERKTYMLRNKNDSNFGTHLVVDDSEYDMGWMAFQNGELVGFVYDGAYSGLEGDNLRLGSN